MMISYVYIYKMTEREEYEWFLINYLMCSGCVFCLISNDKKINISLYERYFDLIDGNLREKRETIKSIRSWISIMKIKLDYVQQCLQWVTACISWFSLAVFREDKFIECFCFSSATNLEESLQCELLSLRYAHCSLSIDRHSNTVTSQDRNRKIS